MTADEKRRTMRALRQSLSPYEQQDAAQKAAQRLSKQAFFRRAKRVAFYMANDGEIDPQALLKVHGNYTKHWFLPRIQNARETPMRFGHYTGQSALVANRYGILEPNGDAKDDQKAASMDVILLPLVAFDRQGNRLGMGGGYYDKTLHSVPKHASSGPLLIGLAHAIQELGSIYAQSWDMRLDMIITDRELICAKQK